MTGVELPIDYSNILVIVCIMIGFVAFMRTITVTDLNDSRLFKIMNHFSKGNQSFVSMEDRLRHQAMTNAKSKRFNNKPDHPKPNRRAAIAHTKAKS